jgi:hypothetical protein
MPERASNLKQLFVVILACIAFQLLARYGAAPVADFCSDDWGLFERGHSAPSIRAAFALGASEPDRPVQAAFLHATYRAFGDAPWRYALLGMAMYSLVVAMGAVLAYLLSGRLRAAMLFGVLFALFPNLTESFHWSAMTTVAYMQVAYMGSALAWVLYIQKRNVAWLTVSVLAFAVGLGSYEFGICLPFVYMLLLPPRQWKSHLGPFAAYMAVTAFYLAWRFTHGFGTAHGILFVPRKLDLASTPVLWNGIDVLRWWIGGHMMDALREGWNGFNLYALRTQRLLVAANLAAIAAFAWLARQAARRDEAAALQPGFGCRALLFAAAWAAGGHALSLLSWTAPRLNFFPALGVALALALLLDRMPGRAWKPVLVVLAFAGFMANQGTARQWEESGTFQRRMYDYIQARAGAIAPDNVILIDTVSLRQRNSASLADPGGQKLRTWTQYGNAALIRHFVPRAMVRLAFPEGARPETVFDAECGARIEDGVLYWHEAWTPDQAHETPLERVHRIDAFAVGTGQVR